MWKSLKRCQRPHARELSSTRAPNQTFVSGLSIPFQKKRVLVEEKGHLQSLCGSPEQLVVGQEESAR